MALYGPLCAYPLIVCGKYDIFQGLGRYCRQATPRTIGHGTPVVYRRVFICQLKLRPVDLASKSL